MAGVNSEIKDNWEIGDYLTAEWANSIATTGRRSSKIDRGGLQYLLQLAAGNFSGADIPEPGIFFFNNDNDVPAYGVMLLNGGKDISGGACPQIKQPDIFGCRENFLINGGGIVSSGQFGYAQFGPVYTAAYDSADGTPGQDETWGPRSGAYLLKKNTGGFRVIRVTDSTNHWVLVVSAPMYRVLAKTTATIPAKGSDGSGCTIYTGPPGTEVTTGVSIVGAFNYSNCAINSGKFVFLDWAWWYGTLTQPIYVTLADTS